MVIQTIALYAQLGTQLVTISFDGSITPIYKGSYALVIGMTNYSNGLPSLMGVSMDMSDVKQALENQGFKVILKLDVDLQEMDDAFSSFISTYGQDFNNRVLFYFAGHGYTLKTTLGEELGYIVPVDAPSPVKDQMGFQNKAMEMAQIEAYSKRIRAKHALFIFDACFSGSLFATSRALPEPVSQKTLQPVRQFITSGTAEEQVPDKSIFCRQFLLAIEGDADADRDGYVTGTELGEFLQKSVTNYSRETQHPQYGKIRNPNLDKGDFIFLTREKISASQNGMNREQSAGKETNAPPGKKTNEPSLQRSDQPVIEAVSPVRIEKPKPEYGELEVSAEYTGDLFIDDQLYQTIVENTSWTIYNVTAGKHRLLFKGEKVFETEIIILKDQKFTVNIRK